MTYLLAIDIGGTQIRAGLYNRETFEVANLVKIATSHPEETALERLMNLIRTIWPTSGSVAAIGVAAPGPVDPYQGIIREAPNIPGWNNIPLQRNIEEAFQTPVALGNDANLAALGEWRFGAGQGHHHLIYMTVSTGIGGGVIADDRLLLGVRGLAAEMGHITVIPDGPLCNCGQRGHLEALASGPAMARWVESELANGVPSRLQINQPMSGKVIAEAAKQGDRLALAALERSGEYIGQALADYLHIFNPSIVIIGGGVSRSGELLFRPVLKAINEHVLSPYYLENLTLTAAALGDEAGLMGALGLARALDERLMQTNQ
jgi:glucokinase